MALLIISSFLTGICATNPGYNPGYLVGENEEFIAHSALLITATTPRFLSVETPMQILEVDILNDAVWNCYAAYGDVQLDILTKKPPIVRADANITQQKIQEVQQLYNASFFNLAKVNILCAYYASLQVITLWFPQDIPYYQGLFESYGLDTSLTNIPLEILDCLQGDDIYSNPDIHCLNESAKNNHYEPYIMGGIISIGIMDEIINNIGWNIFGLINKYGDSPCTAHCSPYSDITGYEPDIDDYDRWQRLQESTGNGFFYMYDHVVPGIGFTAKTKFLTRDELRAKKASNPKYDFKQQTKDVVERLRLLATNDTQKMLVEWFDVKIFVDAAIIASLAPYLAWDDRMEFYAGFSSAEYDAVITVWREKRIWDLVRPTTLIKDGEAGDCITTWGGPYKGEQVIDAQDFEAYIRVMPHSEYPSGSRCICLSFVQFVQTFFEEKFGIPDGYIPFTFPVSFPDVLSGQPFEAGSSKIEPGATPNQDLYISVSTWQEYADLCGDSRLWGGMHFKQAIDGADEICDGIGELTFNRMMYIANGNDTEFQDEDIPDFEQEFCKELASTLPRKEFKKREKKYC